MRRIIAAVISITCAVVLIVGIAPSPIGAQTATWVRGYPQQGASGCVEYVAQWSDGTFTATPWECPPGQVARMGTLTASRGYPQIATNGCTEYVTQWSDESFTWVPFNCPRGVVYTKPGGGGSPAATVDQPIAPPPAALPSAPSPAHRFAGTGKQASPNFALRGGLTLVKLSHTGRRNFAVWLMDSSGRRVDLLANEIGPFNGTTALGLSSGGYVMDIEADGAWTVEIQQPALVATGAPPFSGRGKQATALFQWPAGLARIRMRHDGRRNFAIWLLDSSGRRVDLLVNEIGPFDGTKAIRIPRNDVYIMDVDADGNWSIVFE